MNTTHHSTKYFIPKERNIMKAHILTANYGHGTQSGIVWAKTEEGTVFYPTKSDGTLVDEWNPFNNVEYEYGKNNWGAHGKITPESKAKLANYWATVLDVKKSLENSHVLGAFHSDIHPSVIVSQKFVDVVGGAFPDAFDFTEHEKVRDLKRSCPPWEGKFFIATILEVIPSYDPDVADLRPDQVGYAHLVGMHSVYKPRAIKQSCMDGRDIWRDSYTRQTHCTDRFLQVLKDLGVKEWSTRALEIVEDMN